MFLSPGASGRSGGGASGSSSSSGTHVIAIGGRYDGLLKALWPRGAAVGVLPPGAVGATINAERLVSLLLTRRGTPPSRSHAHTPTHTHKCAPICPMWPPNATQSFVLASSLLSYFYILNNDSIIMLLCYVIFKNNYY